MSTRKPPVCSVPMMTADNARGCFDWLIENVLMMLGCFGISRRVRNYSTGENVTSPMINNRMIASTGSAAETERSEKKSFLEWLTRRDQVDQSNEEWESLLRTLKDGVIQWGIRLSHLLVDFLFLASERGDNMEVFEVFKDILKSRFHEDYNNLVVVKRILKLLKRVEQELGNLKNKGEEISKVEISEDLIKQRKDLVDDLADNFGWHILSLEILVSKVLVTRSGLVKTMEEGFGEGEGELNKIEQDMSELRILILPSFKEDSETVKVLKRLFELNVGKLWSRFGQIRTSKEVAKAKFEE